jgi:hypothetical protein
MLAVKGLVDKALLDQSESSNPVFKKTPRFKFNFLDPFAGWANDILRKSPLESDRVFFEIVLARIL